jgi:hypothetical protein
VRDAQQRSIVAVLAMVSSSSSSCHSRACRYERRHHCWQQQLMMCCLLIAIDADSAAEVPEGDWYCWFCAKERELPYQHPKTPVSNRLRVGDLLWQRNCITSWASAFIAADALIVHDLTGWRDAMHQLCCLCPDYGLGSSCTRHGDAQLHVSCCLPLYEQWPVHQMWFTDAGCHMLHCLVRVLCEQQRHAWSLRLPLVLLLQFKPPRASNCHFMLAADDKAQVFHRWGAAVAGQTHICCTEAVGAPDM